MQTTKTTIDDILYPAPHAAPTAAQVTAALGIAKAVADTIKELGEVPAGTLYAQLMGRMELATFEGLIGLLVRSKLIERSESHMLVWIG